VIISVDHKGLEWVTAAYLSHDKVAIAEIWRGVDQHEDNRVRLGLPTRLIAKTFVFRLIYGGSAFSYANDPEFSGVSSSVEFWQNIIDEFYAKYYGLANWHTKLVEDVGRTGKYEGISGRVYYFKPYKAKNGEWKLPRTNILNYPVQGLGADIVMLSRLALRKRVKDAESLYPDLSTRFVNTVHDDIWLDTILSELKGIDKDGNSCYNLSTDIKIVFENLPKDFENAFGVPFNLPCKYEIKTLTGENI
jgi:DNA polymerase I-like protein with 3'-5' exonuclease and polymerase domains